LELSFQRIDLKYAIPIFTGAILSLFVAVFICVHYGFFPSAEIKLIAEKEKEKEDLSLLFAASEIIPDTVLLYYRDPEFKDWVMEFFMGFCNNADVVHAILYYSDEFDISPALTFALCWEESRFNPYAINRQNRNGSIDRGLFQLNNRTFPNLADTAFYNANTNARHGIEHLRYCIDTGGTEISALAIYNAGAGRVTSTGTPYVTLNYISRILENRRKIESRFHTRLIREEESRLSEKSQDSAFGGLFNR